MRPRLLLTASPAHRSISASSAAGTVAGSATRQKEKRTGMSRRTFRFNVGCCFLQSIHPTPSRRCGWWGRRVVCYLYFPRGAHGSFVCCIRFAVVVVAITSSHLCHLSPPEAPGLVWVTVSRHFGSEPVAVTHLLHINYPQALAARWSPRLRRASPQSCPSLPNMAPCPP